MISNNNNNNSNTQLFNVRIYKKHKKKKKWKSRKETILLTLKCLQRQQLTWSKIKNDIYYKASFVIQYSVRNIFL